MTKQETKEALTAARARVIVCNGAYKKAWKTDPGPRGYPEVDRKLSALHEAEGNVRRLEDQLATFH